MKRLRLFLSAFRLALQLHKMQFTKEPKWDKEAHGLILHSFLASDTGKLYSALLDRERGKIFVSAAFASPPGGRDYAAGYAAGFNHYVGFHHLLSATLPPQSEQSSESPVGDGDLADRMSP